MRTTLKFAVSRREEGQVPDWRRLTDLTPSQFFKCPDEPSRQFSPNLSHLGGVRSATTKSDRSPRANIALWIIPPMHSSSSRSASNPQCSIAGLIASLEIWSKSTASGFLGVTALLERLIYAIMFS